MQKIFVIGHSYGGKTILASPKKDFDGLALWDPSHRSTRLFKKMKYIKALGMYAEYKEASFGFLVGKQMRDEEFTSRIEENIRSIRVPIKIIGAGKGILVKGCRWYYRNANKPKELVITKKANHTLAEGDSENQLFKESLDWLKKLVVRK